MINNAYGIGGTIRTTHNLARTLAEQHDVEMVSVFRHCDRPVFDQGPAVRLTHLVDLRRGSPTYEGDDPEHARPARDFPPADGCYPDYSALTDRRIRKFFETTSADVIVGTRAGLNTQIALQAGHRQVLVGQEHLTLATHPRGLRLTLRNAYPRLDALVTCTETDARDYRARMRLPGVRVEAVPGSVPEPGTAPADGTGKWVIAAGRLAPAKRYDLLLHAFAKVCAERPDWRLRIYGRGVELQKLRGLLESLGLHNHAFLMGPAHPLEAEWPKGSIAAVTSSMESFGMTIVEAMRCGLPVVATRCPHGPAEIISDGRNGRLVPPGDVDAIAAALLELINDDALRQRMGRAALSHGAQYDPARIGERYSALFTDLVTHRRRALGTLRTSLHRVRGDLLRRAYTTRDALGRTRRTALRGGRKA